MKMKKRLSLFLVLLLVTVFSFAGFLFLIETRPFTLSQQGLLATAIGVFSFLLTLQGLFTLIWMLYAWENPEDVDYHKSPKVFLKPKLSFTALLPARHEEKVIQDTIKAIDNIKYPEGLKEILVLCRDDDKRTIAKAKETIKELGKKNIKLVAFNSFPVNKPHSLNKGLKKTTKGIVAIFDAEDEPHPDIYNIVNTVMIRDKADVVQSGVQLMNYRSHWFSALNAMEYFFWFKSGLHFFARVGKVTPLGGNTVFFKKHWLDFIGGWDEKCLTEDADIGIRLTLAGAKTRVVYDEKHATQEETPPDMLSFVKQRTRWSQGFLQILLKGDWKRLPLLRQKVVAFYILLSPIMQALLLLYLPLGIVLAFTQKLPLLVSILSFIPLYLFGLQLLVFIVGLYLFTKAYELKHPFWLPLKLLLTFYPFQLMLTISSFRALYRVVLSRNGWEKTLHTNAHREMTTLPVTTDHAK